uniref:Glucan endo-1,3-beta-D-glucosidase n=1 Tax=Oryza brachyantha TaxID=4533 RepID=J3LAN0_ORYBR
MPTTPRKGRVGAAVVERAVMPVWGGGGRYGRVVAAAVVVLGLLAARCDAKKMSSFVGTYGVNYGRIADNLPPPAEVVKLLRMARIKNVKIYDADHSVLDAFRGSGLNLVIAITNGEVKDIAANPAKAMDWLNENVQPYYPSTRIVGITVGNEVLGGQDAGLAEALVGAVVNVHDALKMLRLADKIELTTPHSEAVFANSYPPSACVFRDDLMVYLKPLLDFFSGTGAPFYVNASPFLAYMSDPAHIDINYALFKPNSGVLDQKTNLHYDNMFDAQGPPSRPNRVVKAYIFALFNENLKPGPTTERHYGLFKPDGSVSIDLGFKGLVPSSSSSLLPFMRARERGWIALVQYTATLLSCTFIFLALI